MDTRPDATMSPQASNATVVSCKLVKMWEPPKGKAAQAINTDTVPFAMVRHLLRPAAGEHRDSSG